MGKRAVTYARVSYDDSGTDGRNLDSQQEMCRTLCATRGHVVVRELREDDKGASGADFDLPALTVMLDMARAGEFDVLVVREVDRLSRDQIKASIIYRDLKKYGVTVEYVLYDFPPGPAGDMARGMMSLIAEYQRQDAIIKTARGRRNAVKSGNINVAGRPPYGYGVVEKGDGEPVRRLEVYEPEALVVRLAYDWYTVGEGGQTLTLSGITRRLRELGIPTPSERNPLKGRAYKKAGVCDWNRDIVVRILKSETYAGRWYYGKRGGKPGEKRYNPREHWLELAVPAIVDAPTWQAAQDQMGANRRNAWRQTTEEYLLRHRLTCAKCESAMFSECSRPMQGNAYRYYKCCAKHNKLTYARQCDMPSFRADWVDAEVWKWIRGLLSEPDKLQKAIDDLEREGERLSAPARRQLEALDELIAENKADAEQVAEMGRRKIYKLDKAAAEIAKLDGALANLNKRRAQQAAIVAKQMHSSESVRGVLAFAKEQGPNVEKATQRFDVRRGLMEDLDVTATLDLDDQGVPVVYAACVVGKTTLRHETPTMSGTSCRIESTASRSMSS